MSKDFTKTLQVTDVSTLPESISIKAQNNVQHNHDLPFNTGTVTYNSSGPSPISKDLANLYHQGIKEYELSIIPYESITIPLMDSGTATIVSEGLPTVSTKTTLPTDSSERKEFPLFRGVLCYFPAALAGIAKVSKAGNDKHNYGQELHHDRKKSQDHADCILRHLMDTSDLLASLSRNESGATQEQVLIEVSQFAWRALAYSQELHEKFGSPLAPGAKK